MSRKLVHIITTAPPRSPYSREEYSNGKKKYAHEVLMCAQVFKGFIRETSATSALRVPWMTSCSKPCMSSTVPAISSNTARDYIRRGAYTIMYMQHFSTKSTKNSMLFNHK